MEIPATDRVHARGATVTRTGVSYDVWAPAAENVTAEVLSPHVRSIELKKDEIGFWSGLDGAGQAGDLYQFKINNSKLLPDVASRFQPQGVHGPSECIDPFTYNWREKSWKRPAWTGSPIYELHIGTFTSEGTFLAAADRLAHVASLGIGAIEIMPVADFPGRWNWGYDGVCLYAPARCYGRPDDLRHLIDSAHALGISVILDVVYNHLGPDGNYLPGYAEQYFSEKHHTPWGRGLNLDGKDSPLVRDFIVGNAMYWLDEFRVDGLRLDATHAMPDESGTHIVSEIAEAAHKRGAFVIAEDERNDSALIRKDANDLRGLDAVWADDFHHQVRVALTGSRESYLVCFRGELADIEDVVRHGWSYRGQPFPVWNGKSRGTESLNLPTSSLIFCIENHDQVGNRAKGERLEHLVSADLYRAASLFLCLSPYTPMIFQGQEWSASTPFQFFTDHQGDLARAVSEGRRREFGHERDSHEVPDPQSAESFFQSKLNWDERHDFAHRQVLDLYRGAFAIREELSRQGCFLRGRWHVTLMGSMIGVKYQGTKAYLLLFSTTAGTLDISNEFLKGFRWKPRINSRSFKFGGNGAAAELAVFSGPASALFEGEPV